MFRAVPGVPGIPLARALTSRSAGRPHIVPRGRPVSPVPTRFRASAARGRTPRLPARGPLGPATHDTI